MFVLSLLGVSVDLDRESVRGFHVRGSGESSKEISSLQMENRFHSRTEHECEACKMKQSASDGGGKANLAFTKQGNLREKRAGTEGGKTDSLASTLSRRARSRTS